MLKDQIFNISSEVEFERITLEVFKFQYAQNKVYRQFCQLLGKDSTSVNSIKEIPFLPIEFFKTHSVLSSEKAPEITFTSSGTTGNTTSKHHVIDLKLYEESFTEGFKHFYGNPEDLVIFALLPSYLERQGSSLIYMAENLISRSKHDESGFYLNELGELAAKLTKLDQSGKKILLIGVSFALLDMVENFSFKLQNTIIMETGGMKGRRKEMIRKELHHILAKGFGVDKIHSEYGMTELLSQAYSKGSGVFECPPWMKILIRDPEDALEILPENKNGGINVIDLANLNSCSFLATQDLGKNLSKNTTEILGRFDNSDIRGCNLMVL
ncbi:acyl transferase [Autumnicola psychrophila]|uniref:Acyl transferase n=1 Tax=Autumnicola psychrophila TaxID=3075592 RepID=A0ABU3DN83_9FLAO|nr:acyl transferase [Zunongwangia sp. F225]MDT0685174.1 acyl transferase [Zunongwangia sp. F225]